MTNHQEQIDWLWIPNGVYEPTFLNKICRFDHFADIGVSCEIIKYTKRHNAQAVSGCEVAIFVSDVLELPGVVVQDLDIAGDVPFPVDIAELIESLVGDIGHVQLVVAYPHKP